MKKYKHYLFDWGDTLMKVFSQESGPMYQWSKITAVDGAVETLGILSKTAGCYIATNAAASTKADIYAALERVGLDCYIEDIFCYKAIGYTKPSKEFYNHVIKVLNVPTAQIVMVGDSLENDVKGATKQGLSGIWFNPNSEPVPEGVVAVTSLTELI